MLSPRKVWPKEKVPEQGWPKEKVLEQGWPAEDVLEQGDFIVMGGDLGSAR